MKVTYVTGINGGRDRYVDGSNRLVTPSEYGKDFLTCVHQFEYTGRDGKTTGANGKLVDAKLLQCKNCQVYFVDEV